MKIEFVAAAFTILAIVAAEETPLLDALPFLKHGTSAVLTLFALGLLYHGLREPIAAGLGRILPWGPAAATPRHAAAFVQLAQVAQELIDAAPTSQLMQYARSGAGPNPADILDWFGIWIIGRDLPIYGRRPPSTTFEPIAAEDLKSGMVDGGARVLRWQGADHLTFHDLAVRRSDLKARRSEFIAAVREGALS